MHKSRSSFLCPYTTFLRVTIVSLPILFLVFLINTFFFLLDLYMIGLLRARDLAFSSHSICLQRMSPIPKLSNTIYVLRLPCLHHQPQIILLSSRPIYPNTFMSSPLVCLIPPQTENVQKGVDISLPPAPLPKLPPPNCPIQ